MRIVRYANELIKTNKELFDLKNNALKEKERVEGEKKKN